MWIIRRKLTKKPNFNPSELRERELAIEKVQQFERCYTWDIFLEEHRCVQGVEQVMEYYPSEILHSHLGLKRGERTIEQFREGKVYFFESMESSSIVLTELFYWATFFDWDRFLRGIYMTNYSKYLYPAASLEYLYSDSEYRKRGQEKWLMEWWQKVDPKAISPSNPSRPFLDFKKLMV